jgi:hypothetical protein
MDNIDKIEVFLGGRPFNGNAKEVGWHAHRNTPGVHPGTEMIGPQEASKRLREVANHIDLKTVPFPGDINTALARLLAENLVPNPGLPASIAGMTADQKADLLLAVVEDAPFHHLPTSTQDVDPFMRVARLFGRIASLSEPRLRDVSCPLQRINIMLRLWAGCLDAGKTIADQTRSGANDAAMRTKLAAHIESIAAADAVYEAGMEATVIIKRRRAEKFSFDGVPDGTRLAKLKSF